MAISFNVLDLLFALLILAASIRGALRGFVSEAGSVAALVVGIGAAVLFSKGLAGVFENRFGPSPWNQLIAFLVIFLGAYLAVKVLEHLLHSLFEKLELERLDRAMGFFLGVAEGLVLCGALLFLMIWQPVFQLGFLLERSFFARMLSPLLPPVSGFFGHA